jgi:AraC-like DNA-binding protein
VSDELGYESVTAFITMFKKALGHSPGRYFAALSRTQSEAVLVSGASTDADGPADTAAHV